MYSPLEWTWEATDFVRASLLRLSKLCPVSAPFSFDFINAKDWRVGKTASRS